jgi:aminoglycoside phosphotransferase (APT) family kinase protein
LPDDAAQETIDRLLQFIRTDFPDLPIGSARLIEHGWDHNAIDIDDRFIFRFPKDDDTRLPIEIRVLEHLRGKVTLPIPRVEFVGRLAVYAGYVKIPGVVLTPELCAALPQTARTILATELARFLLEVHQATPVDTAKALGVPDEVPRAYLDQASELLHRAFDANVMRLIEATLAEFETLIGQSAPQSCLYNDLHGDNMAFDASAGRLNGIFDFGDVAIGDLHREFGPLYRLNRDVLERTVRNYEQLTGITLSLRRIVVIERVNSLSDLAETIDQPGNDVPGKVTAEIDQWLREADIYA